MTTAHASYSPHPTYPNPTVREAICDIAIDAGGAPTFSVNRPGSLFKAVLDEYPEFETLMMPVMATAEGGDNPPNAMTVEPVLRFATADRLRQIVIGDAFMRVHQLPTYPGWPALRTSVIAAWEKFSAVANPIGITRVSARYINILPRTAKHPNPSDWLERSDSYAGLMLNSAAGKPFVSRVESWIEKDLLTIVNVGLQYLPGAEYPPIIFDLEVRSTARISPGTASVSAQLDRLHENVWELFQEARSGAFTALLKGDQP